MSGERRNVPNHHRLMACHIVAGGNEYDLSVPLKKVILSQQEGRFSVSSCETVFQRSGTVNGQVKPMGE